MKGDMRGPGYLRLPDLIIIIVFLSIAAFSVDMFRRDLLQTFNLRNVEPAGVVVIKKNTVQRRLSSRVLWDRLANESPVYIGDLIRVAELSAATLYLGDNSVDLDENTLIRIVRDTDGESLRVVLNEGNLSLAAGTEGKSVSIDLNGVQVRAGRGTVLSAEAGESGGISVQVSEGNAQIVTAEGTVREISSGAIIAFNADRAEKPAKAAVVVTQPAPNARYVKPVKGPLTVNFLWNRINLPPDGKLRLEIAPDRKFARIVTIYENLDVQAQTHIDAGLWYWRLLFDGTVLSAGRLSIADGSGPELRSPAFNSLFPYRDKPPVLHFQWAQVPGAVSYLVEVSGAADFSNPRIRRQSSAVSMTVFALEEGSWFWRVMPVFPPVFSGGGVFSTASFFRVEQIAASTAEESGLSRWMAAQAPLKKLPPELPQDIIPPRFIKPPEPHEPPPPAQKPARRLQTPPISPLPAPRGLRPVKGTKFGLQNLRSQRQIVFGWSAVQDANAYIFTLYQQTKNGRWQIVQQTIHNGAGFTLTNLSLLDRGTFVWQVEALNIGRTGAIERRGMAGESSFIIDFPSSAPLQAEDTEIVYDS